jgi:hypothetical protein
LFVNKGQLEIYEKKDNGKYKNTSTGEERIEMGDLEDINE